jgi:outer membrane protein OmpA-like peptidoglycan-associated protein
VGADVRLIGSYGDPITLAAGVQVYLPTGSRTDYTGDGKARVAPRVLGAGDLGPLTYAGRLGFQYRPQDSKYATGDIGSEVQLAAAVGLRMADKKLVVGPEFYGSTVVSSSDAVFKKLSTPVELIVGGHYTFANMFRAGLGVGPGLTRAFGTPQVRVLASLEYVPAFIPPLLPPPPPSDRDGDGIIDAEDACPDVPGVRTNDPKTNGCPPPPSDRDGDGIIDAEDACPDVPGVRTNDPKTNGCPPARIEAGEIKINQQVNFKTNSSVILPQGDTVLSAIKPILDEHTEIKKLRVDGHTDSRGTAAYNMGLSIRRAESVVKWLVTHGVDMARLTSKGFGLTKPIQTNKTDEGRLHNRRVEFHIVPGDEEKQLGDEAKQPSDGSKE